MEISIPHFDDSIASRMETVIAAAAREVLTARRILPVEGPFGEGFTALEVGNDDLRHHDNDHDAITVVSRSLSVPLIFRRFALGRRQVAAHLEQGMPLDLTPVRQATLSVCAREEALIYQGDAALGLPGLSTVEGRNHLDGGDWCNVEQVLRDVLDAVTLLDERGYRGPYALALAPRLHNLLFRRYPDGSDLVQAEHLKEICTAGIFKADMPGAVVLSPEAGTLLIGEDLHVDYTLADPAHFYFSVRESLVLKVDAPGAICTIRPAGTQEQSSSNTDANAEVGRHPKQSG
ncbi:family 1 encapsulin nanocompartment shell protein [Thermithiobacillus plumbiphilus]|uniref:Family 1 encapsulin nanocompartment shell protein n=1 Tax=Thermithiobacillus plumbiphilus TaxID=1729899 RepID=A0ABU9D8Y7_9PROT